MKHRHSPIDQHLDEMQRNFLRWQKKPLLQKIYTEFHQLIANELPHGINGDVVELGSGIPDICRIIPDCIRTDIFAHPWVDQTENAYKLTFSIESLQAVILFDVFHHLQYPGTALQEFYRVLKPGGRIIIFDPCVSLLGRLVYGLLHPEPLALNNAIEWLAPENWQSSHHYYAAQGNASRIFQNKEFLPYLQQWRMIKSSRLSALNYVFSGGYSKPQLYPDKLYSLLNRISQICDIFPNIFATRLLVVLEKPQ